jgi:hypothetical protein
MGVDPGTLSLRDFESVAGVRLRIEHTVSREGFEILLLDAKERGCDLNDIYREVVESALRDYIRRRIEERSHWAKPVKGEAVHRERRVFNSPTPVVPERRKNSAVVPAIVEVALGTPTPSLVQPAPGESAEPKSPKKQKLQRVSKKAQASEPPPPPPIPEAPASPAAPVPKKARKPRVARKVPAAVSQPEIVRKRKAKSAVPVTPVPVPAPAAKAGRKPRSIQPSENLPAPAGARKAAKKSKKRKPLSLG